MVRYFTNTYSDLESGASVIELSHLTDLLRRTLDLVLKDEHARKDPSIYTGGGGIAYTLWHVTQALTDRDVISKDQLQNLRIQAIDYADRVVRQSRHSHRPWSLLFGSAGAAVVAAVCKSAAAVHSPDPDTQRRLHLAVEQHVKQFASIAELATSSACQDDEFLYGRAGYLMGALYLNRWVRPDAVPDATLAAVASIQLQKGHQQASLIPSIRSDAPLWWEWHGSPYLGAAHGAMGILYVLLNLPSRVLDSIPHAKYHIAKTLEYILSLECDASGARGKGGHYPTRMGPLTDREPLVHWCHGAPGAVFLFGKAHAVLGGPQHLPAALRAGEAIWECGLLRKGPGACHGVAGNAYAFLYLYQITGDEQWRHRAAQFALFMESSEFQRGSRVPDHPFSLFEGWAAAACLYADLMHPEGAAFPLFGLPAVP